MKIFVYGTLMIPEIRNALLKKELEATDGILEGFSANSVIYGQYVTEYPFLKPDDNKSVSGKVIFPVTTADLNIIKYYEGSEYIMKDVPVKHDKSESMVPAFMLARKEKVEYGPEWNYDDFIENHLENYVQEIIPQVLRDYNM